MEKKIDLKHFVYYSTYWKNAYVTNLLKSIYLNSALKTQ